MKQRFIVIAALMLIAGAALAQEQDPPELGPADYGRPLEFRFGGRPTMIPRVGSRVEIMPVLAMIGAQANYSRAANTYIVEYGDQMIQFALDRKYVLVNGTLNEAPDTPIASPGGVAASVQFLERALLSPLDFHLEPIEGGYRILPGARFADPVAVRPAAADFGVTTTLVMTLDRMVEAEVESDADGALVVHFDDASPQLDASVPFRSRRVLMLTGRGQEVVVEVATGVGLINWHQLDDPPRVILELGEMQPTPTPAPARVVERSGPAPIVIDPGHGGEDTGAKSPVGLVEKDLCLEVARRLARELSKRGHTVRLTRTSDVARALTDRTALANRLEARVFVSLHANASTVSAVRGAETYYMSLDDSSTDARAAAIAEAENRTARDAGQRSALDLILWDLAQAEVLNESADLALAVQDRLNVRLGLNDRGVKQAPFVVLTGATMPAILVEMGFLSNNAEARQLATPEHQQRVAESLALGIDDFVRSR